jgi:hypothetical protein
MIEDTVSETSDFFPRLTRLIVQEDFNVDKNAGRKIRPRNSNQALLLSVHVYNPMSVNCRALFPLPDLNIGSLTLLTA